MQPRVLVTLHHPQRVGCQVFARHKPGRVLATATLRAFGLEAANTQALALTQGVKTQADMLADGAAFVILDGARLARNVAIQKITKRTLANETNASGVLFLRIRQANLQRQATHLGLEQFAHREQRLRQLRLVQPMQKIALVFGRVQALEQLEAPIAHLCLRRIEHATVSSHATNPGVVAGGDFLRPQSQRVVQKRLELDLGITQDVRIRCASGLVLA